MASAAVVEAFDVLEDRVGQLDAGAPTLTVEQLGLHAAPERLDHGVIRIADGPEGRQQAGFAGAFGEAPGSGPSKPARTPTC